MNIRTYFSFNNKGFTLLELMVVIIVIGLLAGVVTINVSAQLETRKHKIFAEEIMADLRRARQEAISREEEVAVRFQGEKYIIVLAPDAAEEILKEIPIPKDISVRIDPPSPNTFVFNADGSADSGNIILVNSRGESYYCIIYPTGRIYLSTTAP